MAPGARYRRRAPTWLKLKPEEVQDQITKLAKKGVTPSKIGITLRDSFGVPQVPRRCAESGEAQRQFKCGIYLITILLLLRRARAGRGTVPRSCSRRSCWLDTTSDFEGPACALQVKSVTGNKILRILKVAGLAPTIPEDLYHLIKKAVRHPAETKRGRKFMISV